MLCLVLIRIMFFFLPESLAACCCFCSARSHKLIMLITRNVLVEFIRESFYLPSTHHRVQRCVFIYNQQDRTLLTRFYRRRCRCQRLTTTMICHHPLHLFHNIHRFCPSIYHSFVPFVRVTVPSLIYYL